jgi:hypothetical protein
MALKISVLVFSVVTSGSDFLVGSDVPEEHAASIFSAEVRMLGSWWLIYGLGEGPS